MGKVKERLIQGYYCTDCGKDLGKQKEKGQRRCLECESFKKSVGDSLKTINTMFDAVEIACEKGGKS